MHQGARGEITGLISGTDRFTSTIDLGKLGVSETAFDGKRGWSDSSYSPFEELFVPRLGQLKCRHPLSLLQDWCETFDTAAVLRSGEFQGEKVLVLKLSGEGVPSRTLHVSAKSGLTLKEETGLIALGVGEVPITYTYSDYREVNGVLLPFKVVSDVFQTGEIVAQFENSETLDELPDDAFRLTPPPSD